jgi:hypothetical protein
MGHGVTNYIDTKAKCCHLKNWPLKGLCGKGVSEFIDWRKSIFDPALWTVPPLTFSPIQLPYPPFPVWISIHTVYTYKVCLGGGGYGILGLRQINTVRKVPLHVNFVRWRHFALPSISLIFVRDGQKELVNEYTNGRKKAFVSSAT